jgi:CelD/BcsL family acetyltransferase involved in cellulose biosynthesis
MLVECKLRGQQPIVRAITSRRQQEMLGRLMMAKSRGFRKAEWPGAHVGAYVDGLREKLGDDAIITRMIDTGDCTYGLYVLNAAVKVIKRKHEVKS